MNENEDSSVNTLTILSNDHSYSSSTGALTVKGGVGIEDNLNVCDKIVAKDLTLKNKLKVNNDGVINGNLKVIQDILPYDGTSNIGCENKRWGKIYGNNIITNQLTSNSGIKSTNLCVNNLTSLNKISYNVSNIEITNLTTMITPSSYINFLILNNSETKCIKLNKGKYGQSIKLIITKIECPIILSINYNYKLKQIDDYIELLYDGNKWVFIGGNIRRN